MDWREKLQSGPIAAQVIERIRHGLFSGDLKPGDQLPTELELCELWGVSRTPIREAVKILQYMGIVEIRRSEGTFICAEGRPALLNPLVLRLLLMAPSSEQWLELRLMVELGTVQLAIEKATSEDLARLEANFAETARCAADGAAADRLTELDLEFHGLVARATHNPLIAELSHELLQLFAESIRNGHLRNKGRLAVQHHRQLLDALHAKDLAEAVRATRESLGYWAQEYIQQRV
ncbi:MAG TPA: FCD domain-containing protein [Limnochordia bacterium]|nr:FCD domain-containing protein [Limnochordia bacterium]